MAKPKVTDPFPRWSCDQKDRAACRDPHGCHCREITDLNEALRGKEALVAATLRMLQRSEAKNTAQPSPSVAGNEQTREGT